MSERKYSEARKRDSVDGFAYAAAFFWFAALAILALVGGVLLQPLFCFGDPAPGSPGACPEEMPEYIQDGTLMRLAVIVGGAVVAAVLAWALTVRRPLARTVATLLFGAAAVGWIVVGFARAQALGYVMLVWLGLPASLLLGYGIVSLVRLRRSRRSEGAGPS